MAVTISASTWLNLGDLAITDYPFTISGWFKSEMSGSMQTFVEFKDASETSGHLLLYAGHPTGWVAALTIDQGTVGAAVSVSSVQPGEWHHLAGVFRAVNSRSIYFDGVFENTLTNPREFHTLTHYRVGGASLPGTFDAAEVAIWRSEVAADQIAELAAGATPLSLPCRKDLVAYHDFVARGNRPGLGPLATSAQSPAATTHPRVLKARNSPVFSQRARAPGPFWDAASQSYSAGAAAAEAWAAGLASNDLDPCAEVIS
ncbi:MAG: LamG domain-containing protein [Planctomycetota bacterium]